MEFKRLSKYYYLRIIRLKGEPHELAMGMALGIFSGMLPIMPFHIALAVALALFFRASKITAAIGCWVSNPFDWYILYFLNYKIGSFLLGLSGDNRGFSSVMEYVRDSEGPLQVISRIASSSGNMIAVFLIGGLIMGTIASIPSYFIFLKIFSFIKAWKQKKREFKIAKFRDK